MLDTINMSAAWKIILADTGPDANKKTITALAFAAKKILSELEPGETISTTELGERIWPKQSRDREHAALRKRMFSLLLQTGPNTLLPDWRRRTNESYRNRYGLDIHPWEWFNATIRETTEEHKVGLHSALTPAQKAMDQLLSHYGMGKEQVEQVLQRLNSTHEVAGKLR